MLLANRETGNTTSPEAVPGRLQGLVFDIQRYCVNDGPGIRTTVFLKGCPLRCVWCSNPESQKPRPEIRYQASLCTHCYRCVRSCRHGATSVSRDGSVVIDRRICRACGECVKTCYSEARCISGRYMTVSQVMDTARKDEIFYRTSGGGVTLSGGEPAYQADFAVAILQACREGGIHTAVETCGYTEQAPFSRLVRYADLVLFDVKHLDPATHRQLTGKGNGRILANLKWLAGEGRPVIVRMPLIPSANDMEENLRATGRFLEELGFNRVELAPYHEFGLGKYGALGRPYLAAQTRPPSPPEVEKARSLLSALGLEVTLA
ncbi:MAG: glycyl-radical enzyme activating protein [Chloroflexi bacterium]|nr:glycyl-radical enzyme activating protein [Chloroflexota bacterium]